MMPTLRLPGTVLRSSGEWPCTSALGLFTRKYSAERSKLPAFSKVTDRVLRSLWSRISDGQACASVTGISSGHKPNAAGVAQIVAAHFLRTREQLLRMREFEQSLHARTEVIALSHQKIKPFPQ